MNFKKLVSDEIFFLMLFFSISSLVFQNYFNGLLYFFIGTFVFIYAFISHTKNSTEIKLVKLFIYSIPMSFINIFNTTYSSIPLSWYNIFLLIILLDFFLLVFKKGDLRLNTLSLSCILILFISIIPLIISKDLLNGLKQYINIASSFLLIIVANTIKYSISEKERELLPLFYINSTLIAGTCIFVQYICVNVFGISVGNHLLFAGNRATYAAMFTDFSFMSLYLVSGSIMIFSLKNSFKISNLKLYFLMSYLLLASLITSARTGLAAFIVVILLISLIKLFRLILSGSIKAIYIVFANVGLIIVTYSILKKFRPEGIFDDSGRALINKIATQAFLNAPIFGIGLGVKSYSLNVGTIPHNLIFQLLAQGGLFLTIPMILFLIFISIFQYKTKQVTLLTFLVLMVGSLFIPDIFNSRFLAAIFLIIGLQHHTQLKIIKRIAFK